MKGEKSLSAAKKPAARQSALLKKSVGRRTVALKKPPILDPEAYNAIVVKARLVDLRLIASTLDVHPQGLAADRSGWSMSVGDKLVDWAMNVDEKRLWARVAFTARCLEGDTTPIKVTGDYLVGYSIEGEGEVDQTAARVFLRRVARFACYPYFRSLFASLTGQANLVFAPLPILKEPPRAVGKKRIAKAKGPSKTD